MDIIIFAAIAAFLGLKLRSVLGQRNEGDHRPPVMPPLDPKPPLEISDAAPDARGNVIDLDPKGPPPSEARPAMAAPAPNSLAGRLHQIQQADPRFNEKLFVSGAKSAFEMIVAAFAKGDSAALRPLLADDVYDNFTNAIRARQAAGQTLETRIVKIRDTELLDAEMRMNTARVTMRFTSDQIQTLKDSNGQLVEGDGKSKPVVDVWVFSRNTRAADPNWQLAETGSDD